MSNIRRTMMAAGRRGGSAVDWESIARGMVDNTYAFDITGVSVKPTNSAFYFRTLMTGTATIMDGETKIDTSSFYGCESLTGIVMPNTVTLFSNNCFANCKALTSINIPTALTQINSYVFQKCNSLTSITFPATLTTMQAQCIVQCATLQELIFQATTPPSYGANAIYQNNALTAIYVPDASVSAYQATSGWSTYASIIKGISERPT